MQHRAVYYSANSLYMFRVSNTPLIRSTSLERRHFGLTTLEGSSCTVPEAVVTVLCTPDDGCG